MEKKSFKVLGLVGSARKNGNSDLVVKQALKGAESAGAEKEYLRLTTLNLETCKGCLFCVFKGKCPQKDDLHSFLSSLMEADGLVLGAPTYLLSPAAVIKRLLDRMLSISPFLDELLKRPNRPAITFSVAGNHLWNPQGVEMVNQLALALGFVLLDYREVYAPGPGEVLLDDNLMAEIYTMGEQVVYQLEKGTAVRKAAKQNQCPVCYSQVFRLEDDGTIQCPICVIKGKMVKTEEGATRVIFADEEVKDHFWAPEHRIKHMEGWIKKTREPFMARKDEIKQKLLTYGLDE